MTDFNSLPQYGTYIRDDPFRFGLHYPAVGAELGAIKGKLVLDVGCGDSPFPVMLARLGASVVGFDIASDRIEDARNNRDARALGIEYVVASQNEFSDPRMFDAATSIMALPYAASIEGLTGFFRCAHRHLASGGKFVSIVLNPSFGAFGEVIGPRRFIKRDGSKVEVEFLNQKGVGMHPLLDQFTRDAYERSISGGGMVLGAWKPLFATEDAVSVRGAGYWHRVHEAQPYAVLVARKN